MDAFKSIIFSAAAIAVAVLLELSRLAFAIPITLIDLFLTPLCSVICFFVTKHFIRSGPRPSFVPDISVKKVFTNLAALTLIALPLGIWATWIGLTDLFAYLTGVKGAMHGYTLCMLGIALLMGWAFFVEQCVVRLKQSLKKKV